MRGKPAQSGTNPSTRRRDLLELGVGYMLIVFTIWTPRSAQRPLYLSAIIWIILATAISFDGTRAMGLRTGNLLRSLWIVPAALTLTAAAISAAIVFHTLNVPPTPVLFINRYWGYAIWACLQQFLLQDFFLLRLLRLLPSKNAAILASAVLFSFAHLPNPILTPLTFFWGLASGLLFLCYRNLYPIVIAHAVLGITLAITVPGPIDHNMRVGLSYLTYHDPSSQPEAPHSIHQRVRHR